MTKGQYIMSCHMKQWDTYALIEFPESTPSHGWIIPSINFSDLIPLDTHDFILSQISGKWYCQIIPQ